MSTELASIYQLIPRVMADIGGVAKTRKNEQQKYSFRGIEDFYLAAHPAMITHGVFCAPQVLERSEYRFEKTNEYGKVTTWLHVAVKVEHKFYGPDGSFVPVTTWGEGLDNSDKATNKAMSGAMKYALIELFCVPTQDVEDADRTTPENGTRRPPVSRTTEDIPFNSAASTSGQAVKHSKGPGPTEAADTHSTAGANGNTDTVPAGASRTPESPVVECISVAQQKEFHAACRGTVPKEDKARRLKLDDYTYQWLIDNGYVGMDGEPSASKIPVKDWPAAKDKAARWVGVQ